MIKNQSGNIGQQKTTWSGLYNRELTQEEVKEIVFNLNGFFSVLQELADEEERIKQEDGNKIDGNSNHAG